MSSPLRVWQSDGRLGEQDNIEYGSNGNAESNSSSTIDTKFNNPLRIVKLWATFQDDINLYLITENLLEYGGKELWEYSRTFGLENHSVAAYTFYQICLAVQQCHHYQVLHRDLKPENMFYTNNRSMIKLIDFGSSMMVDQPEMRKVEIDNHPKRNKFTNFVGTPQFMAPEWIHNQETSYASDIWSLGWILYQLYSGINWFRGGSEYLVFLKSSEAKYQYVCSEQIIPQKAKDLIDRILKLDPKERISLDEILNDELFDDVRDLKELPPISKDEEAITEIRKDILSRYNVYKLGTQEEFDTIVSEKFKESVSQEYYDANNERINHLIKLGKNYVFDIEWNNF